MQNFRKYQEYQSTHVDLIEIGNRFVNTNYLDITKLHMHQQQVITIYDIKTPSYYTKNTKTTLNRAFQNLKNYTDYQSFYIKTPILYTQYITLIISNNSDGKIHKENSDLLSRLVIISQLLLLDEQRFNVYKKFRLSKQDLTFWQSCERDFENSVIAQSITNNNLLLTSISHKRPSVNVTALGDVSHKQDTNFPNSRGPTQATSTRSDYTLFDNNHPSCDNGSFNHATSALSSYSLFGNSSFTQATSEKSSFSFFDGARQPHNIDTPTHTISPKSNYSLFGSKQHPLGDSILLIYPTRAN